MAIPIDSSRRSGVSWKMFRLTTATPRSPDGVLDTNWFVFKKDEPLIEGVWRWFDSHYTAGIGALMFEAAE